MAIKIKLFIFNEKEKNIQWTSVREGSNNLRSFLKDLSDQNLVKFIKNGCIVIINDQIVTDDRELKDGDEIKILPVLQGG